MQNGVVLKPVPAILAQHTSIHSLAFLPVPSNSSGAGAGDFPHQDLIVSSCEEQSARWGEPTQVY